MHLYANRRMEMVEIILKGGRDNRENNAGDN
jgi:hypothetical protein